MMWSRYTDEQIAFALRQPEIVVGTWRVARKDVTDLTEAETHDALHRLDPLWEKLFPAEQARIVRSLVERVVVGQPARTFDCHWIGSSAISPLSHLMP